MDARIRVRQFREIIKLDELCGVCFCTRDSDYRGMSVLLRRWERVDARFS